MKEECDVLLMVTTDLEFECAKEVFSMKKNALFFSRQIGNRHYRDLGLIGQNRTFIAVSGMASTNPRGSHNSTLSAIDALNPKFIVMLGIAFGINQSKQEIGTVLIANHLIPYEHARIGAKGTTLRDERPPASNDILNSCRNTIQSSRHDFLSSVGPVLTGEKLVDNKEFKKYLVELAPNAIGGEMEGAGLYSACAEKGIQWALIKSICDWGEEKNSPNKDMHQRIAARNAAIFTRDLLLKTNFSGIYGNQNTTKLASNVDWKFRGGFKNDDELLSKLPDRNQENLTRYELCRKLIEQENRDKRQNYFQAEAKNLFESFNDEQIKSKRPNLRDARTAALIAHQLVDEYSNLGSVLIEAQTGAAKGKKKEQHHEIPSHFNRIYPNTVNSFVKELMNLTSNDEKSEELGLYARETNISAAAKYVIKASVIKPAQKDEIAFIGPEVHAAYVLGRVKSDQAKNGVKEILLEFEKKVGNQLFTSIENNQDTQRQLRLMRRTSLLSQAMLGSKDAVNRYMDLLKNNYQETDVNAGFHLEYYCDQPLDERLPLCSRDKGGEATNTVNYLASSLSRMSRQSDSRSKNPIKIIEIYTLTSIVGRRLFSDRWQHLTHEALPVLMDVYDQVEDDDICLFLEILKDAASTGRDFASREIGRFFAAKNAPRNGWITRGVRYPESVGSHTASLLWLCNLIPASDDARINVAKIKRMLEIHDLAEGITGDIPQPDRGTEADSEERRLMRRLSWLGIYLDPVVDLFEIYGIYEEFRQGVTLESKIANDLDKIDIVIQCSSLLKTKAEFERNEVEEFAKKMRASIVTEQGKIVLGIANNFEAISLESFSKTVECDVKSYFFKGL